LDYSKGHVINEAMDGFKCKDCKYYMFSHRCLLLKGTLEPEIACAFIVKPATGLRFNVDRDKLSFVIFNNTTIKKAILIPVQQKISFSFYVDAIKHYSKKGVW
jgi:hypothetical protein